MASFLQRQTDGLDNGTHRTSSGFTVSDTFAVIFGTQLGPDTLSGWYRFDDVTIPKGSTVTSAKLIFTPANASQPGTPGVEIFGFAEDDSARIAHNDDTDYHARARTTESVLWSITDTWVPGSGVEHDTPDLTAIVQEIIDRAGWVSGNAMAFTVEDEPSPSGSHFRRAVSVDNPVAGASGAAQLFIEFDDPTFVLGTLGVNYTPRFGGTPINLILDLRYRRWQETIETGAMTLPTAGFRVDALALNIIKMVIDVDGFIYGAHAVHPVVSGEAHVPDVVDIEEAAILINKDAPVTRVSLTLPLVSGVRTYEGVISRLALIGNGGVNGHEFKLTFTAAWNTVAPALREWN
jgi:hypothetical protein